MQTTPLFTQLEVNQIIVARFNGESLQIVADRFNTSREVIRSIESQYLRNIKGETNE